MIKETLFCNDHGQPMLVARLTSFLLSSMKNTLRLVAKNAACSAAALSLVSATSGLADVYTYECDSLPTDSGWTLLQVVCGPEQWTNDGLLFQEVPICEENPNWDTRIDHGRDIENLEGVTSWFAEWRLITTGISEELPWTAPAHLVVWDGDALVYHFSIADDRVRFIRQLGVNPTLYFDITPLVWHAFRVELYGSDLGNTYVVYIDGETVDSGQAEGPLLNPPFQARVNMRAKSHFVLSVASWDYIRWGEIPVVGSGDFNNNLEIDPYDLYFFQECLATEAGGWRGCAWADMNFDDQTDCDDWALFQEAWTDPADPPAMPGCDCAPADLDCNGSVSAFDLALLLGNWGPCPDEAPCPADLNGDGEVNAADLAVLLGNWG